MRVPLPAPYTISHHEERGGDSSARISRRSAFMYLRIDIYIYILFRMERGIGECKWRKIIPTPSPFSVYSSISRLVWGRSLLGPNPRVKWTSLCGKSLNTKHICFIFKAENEKLNIL